MNDEQQTDAHDAALRAIGNLNASAFLQLELQRFKDLNSDEARCACFCNWVRTHLKLGIEDTDLRILQTMAPHYFIWCAAWKAKS
jgi:hypothetical protein